MRTCFVDHGRMWADGMRIFNLANIDEPGSWSNYFRQRRFAWFERLVKDLPRPLEILDIGGTWQYWQMRGWHTRPDVRITLLNPKRQEQRFENITPVIGDACDLSAYADRSVPLVFSNSVIEHLFTFERQQQMAREIERVARAYWVQTPNFWFPMEPHFHVLGWQWMPRSWRVALLLRRQCGWARTRDPEQARVWIDEHRLLSRREFRRLFPDAVMLRERFLGWTKSFIAVSGFPALAPQQVRVTPRPQMAGA